MPRPRKVVKLAARARELRRQLLDAGAELQPMRGCLVRLASLEVEPVYAELAFVKKATAFGDYEYPVVRLCPYEGAAVTECENIYITRFREFGEAFAKAAALTVKLAKLREVVREVLEDLDELQQLLEQLDAGAEEVEAYRNRSKVGEG